MEFRIRNLFPTLIFTLILAGWVQLTPGPARSTTPPQPARPAVLEFGAGYCVSCIEMEKVMAELKVSHGDKVEFRMLYVNKEKELFQQYKIMLIPTQVFLDAAGNEVFRHVGALSKDDVLNKLKELKLLN
ncbi:MAG: hypothetical protein FJ128_08080 [Deltaproteobacteria bacterium]|nr:hypothetical protein [Deltaproteobacteria bacterium]